LKTVEFHTKTIRSDPNDFAVGPDGDFEVWKKKALGNYLIYRKLMPAFNVGAARADISHNAFVMVAVDDVVGNYGTFFPGMFSLISFFPAVEKPRKCSLVVKGQIVDELG
jgi:hypothetical protein